MNNGQLVPKFSVDQWIILALAVLGLAVSFSLFMKPEDQESVYIRGTQAKIPGTCFSRQWLDFECPGCGMTRSVVCLSQGEWVRSLKFNVAGLLLYVYAIGYIGFAMLRTRISPHHFLNSANSWKLFVWLVVSVVFLQWVLKLLGIFL